MKVGEGKWPGGVREPRSPWLAVKSQSATGSNLKRCRHRKWNQRESKLEDLGSVSVRGLFADVSVFGLEVEVGFGDRASVSL